MKVKITPLNIVSALAIMLASYLLFFVNENRQKSFYQPNNLIVVLCLVSVIISFIADQIFRKMIVSLRKLWLVELTLIVLTILFTIVLRFIFK